MSTLPVELLDQICWELVSSAEDIDQMSRESKRGALFNLMRSNRFLYSAARPVLYRSLTCGTARSEIPLQHLLWLCATQPETPSLIRELCLGPIEWDVTTAELRDPELSLAATELLEIPSQLRERIQQGLRSSGTDAQAALLLCMCKKLDFLSVYSSNWDRTVTSSLVELTIARSPDSLPPPDDPLPLQLIRSFRTRHFLSDLGAWDVGSGLFLRPEWVQLFLRLPNLEKFQGTRVELNSPASPRPPGRMTLPRLHTVHLLYSDTSPFLFENLLLMCPNLHDLTLRHDQEGGMGSEVLEFKAVGDLLRKYRTPLEKLELHFQLETLDRRTEPFGNLAGFGNLRELRMDWGALFWGDDYVNDLGEVSGGYLADMLPDSLESIEIRHVQGAYNPGRGGEEVYMRDLQRQIVGLLKCERLGRLREIKVDRQQSFGLEVTAGWKDCSEVTVRSWYYSAVQREPDVYFQPLYLNRTKT